MEKKQNKWLQVLEGMITGRLDIGSRMPMGAPTWATLEVVTGGFATGQLLAGGELQPFELQMAERLEHKDKASVRSAITGFFLSELGQQELQEMLATRKYKIDVPENGALLVVAWLLRRGDKEAAKKILDAVSGWISELRFYPAPTETPMVSESGVVQLQNVGATINDLQTIRTHLEFEKQREALMIWTPLYDKFVSLFVETMEDGWPCQVYPPDWKARAKFLLANYQTLRTKYRLCKAVETANSFAQLRRFAEVAMNDPQRLTGREVGRIRSILNGIEKKRGLPDSERADELRATQAMRATQPTKKEIAQSVIESLETRRNQPSLSIDAIDQILARPTKYNASIRSKLLRSASLPLRELLEAKVVGSAEQLAAVAPQVVMDAERGSFADEELSDLYSAIYQAFRKRRSLLLLNYEKQVQIRELPWVAALAEYIEPTGLALKEIAMLELEYFPEVIIPNKMTQELRFMVKAANLELPIVEELAADIFMGGFTEKFVIAAHHAAEFMRDSIYQRYYSIDTNQVLNASRPVDFATLCYHRAKFDEKGKYSVAANGTVIEQAQILTTHNLAMLFDRLHLHADIAQPQTCLAFVERQQAVDFGSDWHSKLIMLKNTAYAWRQMLFYLSFLSEEQLKEFMVKARASKLNPLLMRGLEQVVVGENPDYCFVGWTVGKHPLVEAS